MILSSRMATTVGFLAVSVGAIMLAGGRHEKSQPRDNPIAASTWKVIDRIPLVNDYEIVMISRDTGSSEKRLDIHRHQILMWSSTEFSDGPGDNVITLPALSGVEPLLAELAQDITHDGIPNLVVREYTGGGHCCTVDHIFWLPSIGPIHHDEINYGHDAFEAQHFVPTDQDGGLSIVAEDWTFAYWKLPFITSPAPHVQLRLGAREADGRRRWVFGNTKERIGPQQWEGLRADAERRNAMQGGPADSESLPGLLSNTLDLTYAGNARLARAYVDLAFGGRQKRKLAFLIEYGLRLSSSSYINGVLELNGVATIGQLLSGDTGHLGIRY